MSSEPRDLAQILQDALDLPPDQRPAFLDDACAGDSPLREEIESLIRFHERAGTFLETPPLDIASEALATGGAQLLEGQTIGAFRIEEAIGSGGMGEVYRATDTRLGRTVAMKFLPARLSDDAELRQRLEREAQAISRLNHPNICTLYDVGRHEGSDYLVMEYLEGSTLEERLKSGPLLLADVLRYGIEMAGALQAAHREGITHRDIKPANIMLVRTGSKLLDFGLAKVLGPAVIQAPKSSAGKAIGQTARGMILGTVQYMSPEQLEGEEVDSRADIFALGAVLYEMVTGRKAFEGKSQASVIAAIMSSNPPPVSSVQPTTPRSLDHVIRRCLARDPEERWQTAQDVRNELRWIAEQPSSDAASSAVSDARSSGKVSRRAWTLAAASSAAAFALGTLWPRRGGDEAPARSAKSFYIYEPEGTVLSPFPQYGGPAVSPDGSRIVFAAMREGVSRLYLRILDSADPKPLPGTEGGCNPFWSADNSKIAFFAEGKLRSMNVAGGAPQTICEVSRDPFDNQGKGGTWNAGGDIVFATTREEPLYRVSSRGGVREQLTTLDSSAGEVTHRWPWFLPDGRRFIFQAIGAGKRSIHVGSLDPGEPRVPLLENQNSSVFYAEPGYLLYVADGGLMAQAFDAETLRKTGTPSLVMRGVPEELTNRALFSVSNNGLLVSYGGDRSRLVQRNREGKHFRTVGLEGRYLGIRIGADSQRAVYSTRAAAAPTADSGKLWVLELGSGQQISYSAVAGRRPTSPRFSPDGKRVFFESNGAVYENLLSEEKPKVSIEHKDYMLIPLDAAHGFLLLLARQRGPASATARHLWHARIETDGKLSDLKPFHETEFVEKEARFSPDGRWIAYTSDESGQEQVYVREFPSALHKTLISKQGGNFPVWGKDGREIVYLAPNYKLTSVAIEFVAGVPTRGESTELFALQGGLPGGEDGNEVWWDMTPDGTFYILENLPNPITVIDNWLELNRS